MPCIGSRSVLAQRVRRTSEVPIVVTNAAPDQKPAAPGERRPVAMTPYAIAVALFAAFVVGGILTQGRPAVAGRCNWSRDRGRRLRLRGPLPAPAPQPVGPLGDPRRVRPGLI